MHVVVVDAGDVGVGDHDEGETAQSAETVGEAYGDEGKGEIGRGEEGGLIERWAAMSTGCQSLNGLLQELEVPNEVG